jgi:hypothetical protein
VSGYDNDRKIGPRRFHVPDDFQPIHVRHEQIDDQKIELSSLKKLKAISAIIAENDSVIIALQYNLHGRPNRGIVVNNQNVCHTAPGSAKDRR